MTMVVHHYKNITIHRRHDRVAYARNGNTHNPTKYYVYDVFSAAGGHQIAYGIRTLAKAKEYASETQQSQTWLI